jgi:hypothetical protein
MEHSIEITHEAFYSLSNSFDTPSKIVNNELCIKAYFEAKGMKLLRIYNFVSDVNQYYLQDINA